MPEPAGRGRVKQLIRDWKIGTDQLPDLFGQLNRGQSAEIVNTDGVPLRLWVNPKARGHGVEPLVKQEFPPGAKRDFRKIAVSTIAQHLGE